MAYHSIETPRTEFGDQSYLVNGNVPDLDFSTVDSIPSPSRDGNDLVKHLRGMRAPNTAAKQQTAKATGLGKSSTQGFGKRNNESPQSPRSRLPLLDRRNAPGPSKAEFTPLLKSATRNQQARTNFTFGKENPIQTPMALKANYRIGSSPPLPLNSSMMRIEEEEFTGSELAEDGGRTPIPPMLSSSAMSTPAMLKPRTEAETREKGGNLATLREQEARLEQIDKENFGLKLKIHFLEESLRKNGKEFNEAALKENTELKVDKVQLQRDLKHHRKLLTQAEKDLEQYRKDLTEYMERFKNNQDTDDSSAEVKKLRTTLDQKDEELAQLREQVDTAENQADGLEQLREKISDLEQDIRDRERQLDDKENEVDRLQEKLDNAQEDGDEIEKLEMQIADFRDTIASQDKELEELRQMRSQETASQTAIEQLHQQLQEREDDIEGFREALRAAGKEQDRRLADKDRQLEEKDDELRDLEAQLKTAGLEVATNARSRDELLDKLRSELHNTQKQLTAANEKAAQGDVLQVQLREHHEGTQTSVAQAARLAETEQRLATLRAELEKKSQALEEKDFEVEALQNKLDVSGSAIANEGRVQKLEEENEELRLELQEQEQRFQEKEDFVDNLQEKIRDMQNAQDDELIEAQDRIQELEEQEKRNLRDLQALRDDRGHSPNRNQELQQHRSRIEELEEELNATHDMRKQLSKDAQLLQVNVDQLERELKDKEQQFQASTIDWEERLRATERSKSRAEQRCSELQSTIDSLHESEGTLADREAVQKQALESERRHFKDEEQRLGDEIKHLKNKLDQQTVSARTNKTRNETQDTELEALRLTESSLNSRVEALEDEIEVLQVQADEDVERARADVEAAKTEVTNVRRQLRMAQTDLAKTQTEARNKQLELDSVRGSDPEAQSRLSKRCDELAQQISVVTQERETLRAQLDKIEQNNEAAEPLRAVQVKLRDTEVALHGKADELIATKDQLASTTTEYSSIQKALTDLEDAHDKLKSELQEERMQCSRQQREADRKLQNKVSEYEANLEKLEQDLSDAQLARANVMKKLEAADNRIGHLKGRIASLEGGDGTNEALQRGNTPRKQRADTADDVRTTAPMTASERKTLHAMLKDAHLHAEDLQRQLSEHETYWNNVQRGEAEIRSQLKRARAERNATSQRADEMAAQLREMQSANKALQDDLASVRVSHQKAVRFQQSLTTNGSGDGTTVSRKQHTAELRGLAHQIEYLSNRLKREEGFRADLAHTKLYFQRLVDTHARCTNMDLRLVEEMGIPAKKLQSREQAAEKLRAKHPISSFKAVAQTVRACIRMSRGAKKWENTRAKHDKLVRKLCEMKGRKSSNNQTLSEKEAKKHRSVSSYNFRVEK